MAAILNDPRAIARLKPGWTVGRWTFRKVLRHDPDARLFRVFRITRTGVWPQVPALKFSFALRTRLCLNPFRFRFDKSWGGNWG